MFSDFVPLLGMHKWLTNLHHDHLNYWKYIMGNDQLINLLWFRLWMLNGSLPVFSEQDNPAAFSDSHLTRYVIIFISGGIQLQSLLINSTI